MKLDKEIRTFVSSEYFWLKPGELCWVEFDVETLPNRDADVFAQGKIEAYNAAKKIVTVEYGKKDLLARTDVHVTRIMRRDPNKYPALSDLVDLPILNDAELHEKIRDRFSHLNIFTYIGPSLLIINPFKYLKEQYTEELKRAFYDCIKNPSANKVREKPPHVWAIAAQAYLDLNAFKKNQACCISGESGAGKTVNTKTCMSFLTGMNEIFGIKEAVDEKKSAEPPIEDKILMCNPILEALGNAKTVRNDNSSRFGKYISLFMQNRIVIGASVESYLLEAIRVTNPNKSERNYHIFYQYLKGAKDEEISAMKLNRNPQTYPFLNKSGCFEVPTINDKEEYDAHEQSMVTLNLVGDWRDAYWRIIAVVLHLSNIQYDDSTFNGSSPCKISSVDTLKRICAVLEVEEKLLIDALTSRTSIIGGKEVIMFLDKGACQSLSESFAKDIYNKLFSWVIKYLNLALLPEEEKISGGNPATKYQKIGLLDIFGFEIFDFNSIEQLCINFTNEKLHQLYVEYVFKLEVQTFVEEGLKEYVSNLTFTDNQEVLDLLAHPETKKFSVFNLIDDQSATMGKDAAIIDQFNSIHGKHSKMAFNKMNKAHFIIVHTARAVSYNIQGFCDKNKDEVPRPIIKCVLSSKNKRIVDIYNQKVKDSDEPVNYLSDVAKKKEQFIGFKFRQQMDSLMTELRSCQCSFMRCIKPNEQKSAVVWTSSLVVLQIRYLGLLDSIKIRKESYPFRFSFKAFCLKYFELDEEYNGVTVSELENLNPDWLALSERILISTLPQHTHKTMLPGKTKIFLKSEAYQDLEIAFEKCQESKRRSILALETFMIERAARAKLEEGRRRFMAAEQVIGQLIHGMKTRQEYIKFKMMRKATITIQAYFKGKKARKAYLERLEAIKKIQCAIEASIAQDRALRKVAACRSIFRIYKICKVADRILLIAEVQKLLKKVAHASVLKSLEQAQIKAAITIQKRVLGMLTRKKHAEKVQKIRKARALFKYNKAIKVMKKYLVGKVTRRRIRKILLAASLIQAYFKMRWTRRAYLTLRQKVIVIQRFVKPWLGSKSVKDQKRLEKIEKEVIPFLKKCCSDQSRLYPVEVRGLEAKLESMADADLAGLKIHEPYQQIPEVDATALNKARIHTEVIDVDYLTPASLAKYKGSWVKSFIDAHKDAKKCKTEGRVFEIGASHTIMSTLNGRCYCWGANEHGQLAVKNPEETLSVFRVLKNEEKLRFIASGDNHTHILSRDRTLFSFGLNNKGQLGLGHSEPIDQMIVNTKLSKARLSSIYSKRDENYAVTEQGELLFWPVSPSDCSVGILTVPAKELVSTISLGLEFAMIITSTGNLYSFGRENREGQLGLGHTNPVLSPTIIEGFSRERVLQVSCGKSHTVCLTRNLKVFTWGEGSHGQLGTGLLANQINPVQIKISSTTARPVQVASGYSGSFLLQDDGNLLWWGKNSRISQVKKPILCRQLNSVELFPIQIRCSWSESMSVAYLEIADFRYLENVHSSLKFQHAKLMAAKWNSIGHSQCKFDLSS
jgi:myosin-5